MTPETKNRLSYVFFMFTGMFCVGYAGDYIADNIKAYIVDNRAEANAAENAKQAAGLKSSFDAVVAVIALTNDAASINGDVLSVELVGNDPEQSSTKIDFDFSTGRSCTTIMGKTDSTKCGDYNFVTDYPESAKTILDVACATAANQDDEKFSVRYCTLRPSS
jgi:hypothetical protein